MVSLIIGSEVTFKKLFDEYYVSLYFFAKKILKDESAADDIVQETFCKLWDKRKEFEIRSVSGFLYSDVRNRCLNYLKHQKVKEKHINHEQRFRETQVNSMVFLYEEELFREIKKLIEVLPEQQQQILKHTMKGESLADIAESMGISVNTVKTHLLRARKFLRERLKNSLYLLFLIYYPDFF